MYSIRNKSKFNKSIIASSSSSLDDRVMNLGDDYYKIHNVEVSDQGSTNDDKIIGMVIRSMQGLDIQIWFSMCNFTLIRIPFNSTIGSN
jgi:hypothetical protein